MKTEEQPKEEGLKELLERAVTTFADLADKHPDNPKNRDKEEAQSESES